MAWFDRLTKRAASVSSLLIAAGLIALHPDMTPALRVLCTLAVAGGWLAAKASTPWVLGAWVAAALLAPAPLRLLAGREGPVLDLFWMAGLTASLLRVSGWGGWTLAGWTRVFAGGWALTLALGWPVLALRELAFTPRLIFDVGAINAWTGWSAPHVVSWMAFVTWTQLLGLLWLDWVAGRIATHPDRPPRVLYPLWAAATAASLVALYQGIVDFEALSTPFWAERQRASGTMLDANAFGVCAALAAASALITLRGSRMPIAAAIVAVNVAGLWMSGSRSSLLLGLVIAGAAALAFWQAGTRRRLLAGGAAIAIAVTIAVVSSGATGPLRRLFERGEGTTGGLAAVALERGPYGRAANQMIRAYPLTGVGIGTYPHLAADYERLQNDRELEFDNAQNWWRHTVAEMGLLGALPLLAWSAWLAWQVLRGRSRREQAFEATLVRGTLLGIGLGSLFQVQTQPGAVLLWFFVFVAWLPHLLASATPAPPRAASAAALALAIAYAAGHAVLAKGSLAVIERAQASNRAYVVGAYGLETTEGGSPFRWTGEEARMVWPLRTPWFVLDVWAHHPDISTNPVTVSITTACETLAETQLNSAERRSLGLILPEGQKSLAVTIRVSRTWQPSSYGEADSRHIGVGVSADSVATPERANSAHIVREVASCAARR